MNERAHTYENKIKECSFMNEKTLDLFKTLTELPGRQGMNMLFVNLCVNN